MIEKIKQIFYVVFSVIFLFASAGIVIWIIRDQKETAKIEAMKKTEQSEESVKISNVPSNGSVNNSTIESSGDIIRNKEDATKVFDSADGLINSIETNNLPAE